jgi:CubicO group peptidase (beta-lactamase class C family)
MGEVVNDANKRGKRDNFREIAGATFDLKSLQAYTLTHFREEELILNKVHCARFDSLADAEKTRTHKTPILFIALLLLITTAGAQVGNQRPVPSQEAWQKPRLNVLDEFIDTLSSGDQALYETFVKRRYSHTALAKASTEQQAAALARIYAETGGFKQLQVVGETEGVLVAEVSDNIVGQRYCLLFRREREDGRESIADFDVRPIYASGPNLDTPAPALLAQRIDAAATSYTRRGLFSGVILLAKDDKIIMEKAYGMASLAYLTPMTTHTRLNIASIGKMITGAAIAQLVGAGKLSYDDLVGRVLPDLPNKAVREKVTVRQCPNDYYQGPQWESARPRLRTVADYMKLVADAGMGTEPGKYLYSNSGYVILGAIIEKLTGVSYYDYVREHIFQAAGMNHSFYHEMDSEDPDVAIPLTNLFNQDKGYLYHLGLPRNAIYELAARGGPQGGAFMTARDMFAFKRALLSGKLMPSAMVTQMTTAHGSSGAGAPGMAGETREGLGVEVVTRNGHTFFGHTGGDLGVASMLYWYPDTGYTTILLSNRDPRAARVLANLSTSTPGAARNDRLTYKS